MDAQSAQASGLTDAWFDVATAAPGAALLIAIAMAGCIEIPVSLLCGCVAVRAFQRRIPESAGGQSWYKSRLASASTRRRPAAGDRSLTGIGSPASLSLHMLEGKLWTHQS